MEKQKSCVSKWTGAMYLPTPAFPFLAKLFYIAVLKMYSMPSFLSFILFNEMATDMLKSGILSKPNYLVTAFYFIVPSWQGTKIYFFGYSEQSEWN